MAGKGPCAKEYGQPREAGKGKKIVSALEPLEEMEPPHTL